MAKLAGESQNNVNSKRTEYHGKVQEQVQAIVDAPAGGQIIIDGAQAAAAFTV